MPPKSNKLSFQFLVWKKYILYTIIPNAPYVVPRDKIEGGPVKSIMLKNEAAERNINKYSFFIRLSAKTKKTIAPIQKSNTKHIKYNVIGIKKLRTSSKSIFKK